ncbi:MAG: lysozyme inhibitor LprI family protein [Hyphomicrobiaceae bacterium]
MLTAALSITTPAVAQQDKAAMREAACAKLKNATEREICLDRHLTRDDAAMNEVYQILKKKLSKADFKALRAEQLGWLKERNRCGNNYQCIRDAYADRLAVIEQELENLEYPNKSHVEIGCEGDRHMVDGVCVKKSSNAANVNNPQEELEAGMIWQAHRIPDAKNKNGFRRAVLSYGVPETDAVLFEASCDAGKTTTAPTTLMNYQLTSSPNATPVMINLASGTYANSFVGEIYTGADTDEGVVGLKMKPAFNNVFWTVLARGGTLTYAIAGGQSMTLPLVNRGSNRAVRQFLKDCVVLRAINSPRAKLKCDDWGKLKSNKKGAPVSLTFKNNSDGYRAVMWLNAEGTPIDKAALNKGESFSTKTQSGHIWMFTDGPGNCIELYTAQAGVSQFDITTPSPAFGEGND